MALPVIEPMPPVAAGVGLPWDVATPDPVGAIAAARAEHGDTFVLDSGPDRYLFTFSPRGVESFYALPEELASKGLADYRMLVRKLPDEIFLGRRTLPSQLFRRDDVAAYLTNLEHALDVTSGELGERGSVDVFALTRRLAHRMGLASWASAGCAEGERFERLVAAFDTLDGSDAFVHPDAMAAVAASGRAAERAALAEITEIVGADGPPLFRRIAEKWSDADGPERRTGIAHDVALIHVASMSNLAAALGWLLVDLAEHPEAATRIATGDRGFGEQCALETVRLAQRSIMPRYVHTALEFTTEDATYAVDPGVTIATLLPLTNPLAGTGWIPERWNRHRIDASKQVTSFGHGKHSCPAQPFSLAAMATAAVRLFGSYAIERQWDEHPAPVPQQIGGVARAALPTTIGYARRDG